MMTDGIPACKIAETALIVVDQQEEFCDPKGERGNTETEAAAEHIQSAVTAFREAGILICVVSTPDVRHPGFYKFEPAPEDTRVEKKYSSAFSVGASLNLNETLKNAHIEQVLICGVNLSECVDETAGSALRLGFKVCVLSDLTANDKENKVRERSANMTEWTLNQMEKKGVVVATSGQVLKHLRAIGPS